MPTPKIFESEYRFCLILWEHEPVTAVELAKLCDKELGWKRTTTYTIIKRLGERGVLKNESGTVTSLVSKDDAQSYDRKAGARMLPAALCRRRHRRPQGKRGAA